MKGRVKGLVHSEVCMSYVYHVGVHGARKKGRALTVNGADLNCSGSVRAAVFGGDLAHSLGLLLALLGLGSEANNVHKRI